MSGSSPTLNEAYFFVGFNFQRPLAFIIVVGIIMGALYYSGFLGGTKKEKIDINIKAPSTILKIV
jgi:hypothetical protein